MQLYTYEYFGDIKTQLGPDTGLQPETTESGSTMSFYFHSELTPEELALLDGFMSTRGYTLYSTRPVPPFE